MGDTPVHDFLPSRQSRGASRCHGQTARRRHGQTAPRRAAAAPAALAGLALVAAACGGGGNGGATYGPSPDTAAPPASATAPGPADGSSTPADRAAADAAAPTPAGNDTPDRSGGELILAAEQWPECLNPVTSCSGAATLMFTVTTHLLPSLMELDATNDYRASPTLATEPTTANGGLAVADDGTFTLTYRLNPEAVWSDGTPITSEDVRFTWRAVLDTEGSLETSGYDLITGIDTADPLVAVITFSEPYAPWRDMFGVLLPAHALGPGTNVAGQWNDEITVSGGPWVQQSWSQEQHVLVPNENYWAPERMPLVDRVVMVPREDTDSQVIALRTGEVMAAHPQPFPGATERLTGDLTMVNSDGTYVEGLWINQNAPDRRFEITRNVRAALIHALDRELIADVALGSIIDDPRVLQCAGWNPTFGDWCGDDFARYDQDAGKVAELLSAEGWTRPDPDGLWVNPDGEELILQWNTVAGNKRREDVQALVVEMTAPFGIGWEIINYDPGELFQNRLPAMNFGPVALFARGTSPDPSVFPLYDIDGIPSEENGFSGRNNLAYRNPEASALAAAIDREVDAAVRLGMVRQLGAILADDVPWIPLYLLPRLLVWNSTMVEGAGAYIASVYGGFRDIYDWRVIG